MRTLPAFALVAGLPRRSRAQASPTSPDLVTPAPPPVTTPTPPDAAPTTAPAPASSTHAQPPSGRTSSPIDSSKAYYVFFDQTMDANSLRGLRQQLVTLVEARVSEITLVIDSPGGSVSATLSTYSFIKSLPARINTHAQGFVRSAANVLFLAGETRSADHTARFMFHPSQALVTGMMGESQVREWTEGFDTVMAVVRQIYHDRTRLTDPESTGSKPDW